MTAAPVQFPSEVCHYLAKYGKQIFPDQLNCVEWHKSTKAEGKCLRCDCLPPDLRSVYIIKLYIYITAADQTNLFKGVSSLFLTSDKYI